MAKSPFDIPLATLGSSELKEKKRRNISYTEKVRLWEIHGNHICHICTRKISLLSEAELDHVRAHAKGGAKVLWAHRTCNRIKGKKPLSQVQKQLGVYKPKKRTKKRKPKRPKTPKQPSVFSGFELPKNHPLRQPLRF